METKTISAFDANNGFCRGDLFTACGFAIIIKSHEALAVANKVIEEQEDVAMLDLDNLVYDSDAVGNSDYSHDIMDAVREALEAEFGKPETQNSPIEYLGYTEANNDHWAVWSREVEVDEDGEIVAWVEY